MRKLLEPSLYYFSVVAQSGSLTAATERLGLTVSALSRHMTKLEDEIGVPLFDRHARGMELSHAGRVLLRHAQRSLIDAQAVVDEIQGEEVQRMRTIRIACTEGFAFDFLPAALGAFLGEHPEANVELEVVPADVASQMLMTGMASIALGFAFKPEPGVQVHLALPAPVVALMRAGHPLAERDVIGLRDIAAYPVLLQDQGTTNRQLFDIACNVEGIEIVPRVTSRYVAALYRFVQTIPGAVMPSGYLSVAQRLGRDDLVARPFDVELLRQRKLQVKTLARRHLPPLTEACLQWLIAEVKRIDVTNALV